MKTVFYRWYEPNGYHKFTFENTKLWDDTPGNQFKVCVYLEGELLASTSIDAPETYNPRWDVERIAVEWYEKLIGGNQ